jgi:hypothetical protein
LGGYSIFSKIDLRYGYHQVWIKDEYINKKTFRMSDAGASTPHQVSQCVEKEKTAG